MALDISHVSTSLPHLAGEAPPRPVPVVATAASVPAPPPVIPSDLQQTLQEMEKVSAAFGRRLSFSYNQKLDSVVVKVVDSQTDKVIREIPPAELQHVYEAIRDAIGLLFDDKA